MISIKHLELLFYMCICQFKFLNQCRNLGTEEVSFVDLYFLIPDS